MRLWLLAALKFAIPISLFVTIGQWAHHAWSPDDLLLASIRYEPGKHLFVPSVPVPVTVLNGIVGKALWLVWMLGTGLQLGAWLLRLRKKDSTTNVPPAKTNSAVTLKARGKTVFAVTHDDRHYYVADRLLKLDEGTVVSDTDHHVRHVETA